MRSLKEKWIKSIKQPKQKCSSYYFNLRKYYVVDLGFIRSQLQRKNINRGSKIENLVYPELLSRGYEVLCR